MERAPGHVNDLYLRLTFEQYKNLENQLRRFNELETTHKTVDGGYHKAFRLHVTDSLVFEFMGPLVKQPFTE
jgi:hypothetical protein